MAGYSKTPLVKKMGIKAGMRGICVHIPPEVRRLFAPAPIQFAKKLSGTFDYIHLFSTDPRALHKDFVQAKKFLKPAGMLWVSWPKAGKLGTSINENTVRDIGLAFGLVDIKVAAIDAIWSGLKFVYRLRDRKRGALNPVKPTPARPRPRSL